MNRFLCLAGILAMLPLCGCCSFNRAWNKAGQSPPGPNSIEGRWEGRWLSDHNGHTGRLRCVLSHKEGSTYSAYYWATYWKIFRYSYKVDLAFEPRDGVWHFRGEENLGWLAGGDYRYDGRVSSTNFYSTYESKYDHGTFEMNRP